MNEGFEQWNKLKIQLNERTSIVRPKRRQVWWCAIGLNVGQEQSCGEGFERPVLVLRVFGSIFWGVPITSSDPNSTKEVNPLFHKIDGISYLTESGKQNTLHGFVALHQLRAYDSRRLMRKILKMDTKLFDLVLTEVRGLVI